MTYKDIVRFGGDCQVCTYRGEALLCHRWRCCCGRCDLGLHRYEQRGAGCQEHLSPPKVARKHKKANESKSLMYQ